MALYEESVKSKGLSKCKTEDLREWSVLSSACPRVRGAIVFAQTLAFSWEPPALGRGWHLVWPVSPTEAMWFLLGCALHTAGVSHPMVPPTIHSTMGPLPLECVAVESCQLKARTGVAVQHAGVGCNGQWKQGQLCQTPVTSCGCSACCAVPPLQSPFSSSWMQPGVCRVQGESASSVWKCCGMGQSLGGCMRLWNSSSPSLFLLLILHMWNIPVCDPWGILGQLDSKSSTCSIPSLSGELC